jgi:hypothetical protein
MKLKVEIYFFTCLNLLLNINFPSKDMYSVREEESEEEREDESEEEREKESEEEEILDFDGLEGLIKNVSKEENTTVSNFVGQQNDENEDQIIDDLNDLEIVDFNFEEQHQNKPMLDLKINLGSDDLPRYQCGNYKLDIVGRKAVKSHPQLLNITKKINKSNAHFKKVIRLSKIFRENKCRLRLESKTRWSTFYLLLLSVKKAHAKGCFNENNVDCPVSKGSIDLYWKILKPLYMLNISWQSNHSTKADIVPGKINLNM